MKKSLVPSSSSPKSKSGNTKQISPARNWCFTFNNYTEANIEAISSSLKDCSKYVFCKEVGKQCETPHLQGYVEFKTKVRPLSVISFTNIHWEKCKGTKQQNEEYVTKDGGEVFSNYYERPKPLKMISHNLLRLWQTLLIGEIRQEPDDRAIWWLWSNAGNVGKSSFCRYLAIRYEALIIAGSNKDMKCVIVEHHQTTGKWPRLIIIDIPRVFDNDFFSYSGMEEIKNGLFCSSKFKGSMALFNPPHIMVFSNAPPQRSNMSLDRWRIVNIDYEKERQKKLIT